MTVGDLTDLHVCSINIFHFSRLHPPTLPLPPSAPSSFLMEGSPDPPLRPRLAGDLAFWIVALLITLIKALELGVVLHALNSRILLQRQADLVCQSQST